MSLIWNFAALLMAVSAVSLATSAAGETRFVPAYRDINSLHRALTEGRISCAQLVEYYLGRIQRYDKTGPAINAVLRLNSAALAIAKSKDAAKGPAFSSPLYCIPFLVKDNIDTKDLPTTGGSLVLADNRPRRNAPVVQRLLDAGAIVLGKTNMSEMAASYGRLGYSSLGGLTLNPYNLLRDASGSSSGSAAAVAADFAVFALGTDTSGSVRGPASVTGLVGLRPTAGLVSRDGLIPSTLSFDTPAILAKTIPEVAQVLSVIATSPPLQNAGLRYDDLSERKSLRGMRVGVLRDFRGGNPEVDANEEDTLRRLVAEGAVIVPIALPTEFLTLWDQVLNKVSQAEFRSQFEVYLSAAGGSVPKTLEAFIERSDSEIARHSVHPVNPQLIEALRQANASTAMHSSDYRAITTEVIPALRAQLRGLLDSNGIVTVIFPAMACPATPRFDRPDLSYECHAKDPYAADYIASVTGFPEITLPSGMVSAGLPIGLSVLGRPNDEKTLLQTAMAVATVLRPVPHPTLLSAQSP